MKELKKTLDNNNTEKTEESITTLYKAEGYLPLLAERAVLNADRPEYCGKRTLDAVTFLYTRAGAVKLILNDEEVIINSNYGVCIKMGVMYSVRLLSDQPSEVEVIIFHQSAVFGYGTSMLSVKYRNPYMYPQTPDYVLFNCRSGQGIPISHTMDDIYYSATEGRYGWELACKGYLCHLWYQTFDLYRPIPVKVSEKRFNNDEYRVRTAIDYIDQHYMDPITLDDIAESIHISKSECSRVFKRVLDLSPIEYVVRFRIYTAAAILDNPAESPNISDLAISTGHNNISYFIKMFKRYMGVTPTEFREEVAKRSSWVNGNTSI